MVVLLGTSSSRAASKYITVEEFATELGKAIGLTSEGKSADLNS